MKRVNKSFVCEEIIINVLNRLPLKSLARFTCVSTNWRKFIAEVYRSKKCWSLPYLIGFFCVDTHTRFFFSYQESPLLLGSSLDKSVNFIGERVNIVASSNGFLLCDKRRSRHRIYYVYNPVTRQRFDIPKTRIQMKDPYVGFICKGDDDVISFTIVRYAVAGHQLFQISVPVESFSSETNVWTDINIILDKPLCLGPCWDMISSSSACVINGVLFCWLDNYGWITVYDSVDKSFWLWKLPEPIAVKPWNCCLGFSGEGFYFAYWNGGRDITVWKLVSDIRSRDAVWVRKYIARADNITHDPFEVQNMVFHPSDPHILFLHIRGKVSLYNIKTQWHGLVYDFGEAWRKRQRYKLFSYDLHQWPSLL